MAVGLEQFARACRMTECHDEALLEAVGVSFMDTIAVANAGTNEAVVRALADAHPHASVGLESQALLGATAAHALDYDDVQLSSVTHASAVIVPALIAAAFAVPGPAIASGYLAGLTAASQLAAALGPSHYSSGWHATSTIGPFAAAAAVARMWGLSQTHTENALSLALCQAAGLQRSFGSMAKPLQAGLASSNGLRAAVWASRGITGSSTPFGPNGFDVLYSGHPAFEPDWSRHVGVDVSRKPYPCCYASQRLVSAALEIRRLLSGRNYHGLVMKVRAGTLRPLTISVPKDGNEAKFCASYLVAVAITDGNVELRHFQAGSLERPDLANAARKIRIIEHGPPATSIEDGTVEAVCTSETGQIIAQTLVAAFPGSPAAPLNREQMEAKFLDCYVGCKQAVAAMKQRVEEAIRANIVTRPLLSFGDFK